MKAKGLLLQTKLVRLACDWNLQKKVICMLLINDALISMWANSL